MYDYKKNDDSELDLIKGDKIKVLEKDEKTGWWYGYNISTPKVFGFFPNNYIGLSVSEKDKIYVVQYDFVAETPSELTCKKGEELEYIERKNGWVHVINQSKKKGWVPEDYIVPKTKK